SLLANIKHPPEAHGVEHARNVRIGGKQQRMQFETAIGVDRDLDQLPQCRAVDIFSFGEIDDDTGEIRRRKHPVEKRIQRGTERQPHIADQLYHEGAGVFGDQDPALLHDSASLVINSSAMSSAASLTPSRPSAATNESIVVSLGDITSSSFSSFALNPLPSSISSTPSENSVSVNCSGNCIDSS